MRPIAGYDGAQANTGAFERIEAGGYVCVIKRAYECATTGGKDMLAIEFDVAEGKYKDYFKNDCERRQRNANGYGTVKWRGIYRQLVHDNEGNANAFFKGMIQSIEGSNLGYRWDWDETKLTGKRVGIVFRDEEYPRDDGGIGVSAKPAWVRTVDEIKKGIVVPDVKRLNPASGGFSGGYSGSNADTNAPYDAPPPGDDDLPWS